MKKTIALLLSVVIVLSLAACSNQENTSDLSSAVQTEDENYTVNNTEKNIVSNTMDGYMGMSHSYGTKQIKKK